FFFHPPLLPEIDGAPARFNPSAITACEAAARWRRQAVMRRHNSGTATRALVPRTPGTACRRALEYSARRPPIPFSDGAIQFLDFQRAQRCERLGKAGDHASQRRVQRTHRPGALKAAT